MHEHLFFYFRKDNIIFRRRNKSFGKEAKHTSDDSGDHQCSQDVAEQNHCPAPEAQQMESDLPAPEIELTESNYADAANGASNTLSSNMHVPPESVRTVFSRRHLHMIPENNKLISSDDSGDHQCSQDVTEQNHCPASEAEQMESDLPAPEVEPTESSCADAASCASNTLSSNMHVPPESVRTVFSRRRLHMIPENNKLIGSGKSSEDINKKSVVPWTLIPITSAKPHKDINEKVHKNSAHLNKEHESVSRNELKRKRSNSENCTYLPSTRNMVHAETKSERIRTKTRESSVSSSKYISRNMFREPVHRHFHQGDKYRSYSEYKAQRYSHYENYRSRTYPRYAISEHHLHSKRWEFYKIPRITRETSLSRALRSLRSRSRSVSQSRIVPGSVQNSAKRRHHSNVLSESRSCALTEISDKPASLALKLDDSDTSTSHMKKHLSTDTQLENSKDLTCVPQKKFIHHTEPQSAAGASGVEQEHCLKPAKTKPVVNIQVPSSAGSKCGSGSTTLLNLSEHGSFKRSKCAKIVQLNTEINPSEARTTDLVNTTNTRLLSDHDQSAAVKRPLETKETEGIHIPDSKRQVLNDITRRECYNYRANDNFTDHEQLYNGTAQKESRSGSVNENMLKNNKVNEDTTDDIKNMETAMLKEKKKAKEQKEETGSQNIELDAKNPTVENTGTEKETSSNTRIESDSSKLNETDVYVADRGMTNQHHVEHIKFRFDRKALDTKRKTPGSCRPQYVSQRYHERSRTPITFNSHCKRRSPSELLNKDRAGRRLSNQDDIIRTERSRSRSSEGTNTHREPETYRVTDSVDGKSVRYLANKVTSEEQKKKSVYTKGDTRKSVSSQNYKEKKEKHKVEVDGTKENATRRQKEDCSINVHKTVLLEITSGNSGINSEVHDDCGGQTESVRIMESARSAALNETERSGNKELRRGPSTLSVDPSNLNEIIKTNISANNQNSFSRSASVEIIRLRSNIHETGSQVLIGTENSNTNGADLKHGARGICKVSREDKISKSKVIKDKKKEMCISNYQNNETNSDGIGLHSVEVEQTNRNNTKEIMASGQDGYDRNFQKENLLEKQNKAKDNVKKDDPKHQTVPNGTVNTEDEKNRETEFINTKAKRKTNKSINEDQVKKTKHSSDKSKSKNSQDCRSNKQMDEHHETEASVSEESKLNRKQATCNENVPHVNSLKSNEDNRVMKSAIQYQSTKEKPEFSVSGIMNEKQKSDSKESLYMSPKKITAQLPACNEANIVVKPKKTATSTRSKHKKQEERELEEFKVYETSHIKHTRCKAKKAVSEEIQNKKQCKKAEKMTNSLQKHKVKGHNEECGIEVAQIDVDNAEERKKQKKDSTDAEKISCLETYKEDGISVSRIQSCCIVQTVSPADTIEDAPAGIINEKEKSNKKDSKCVLSQQSVLGSSVPDKVNRSEKNGKDKETMLRLKISTKEGVIPRVSENYKILDNADQRDSKHRSSEEENHENEKNISNICQNYETNKEENQQPRLSNSQTAANNAKDNDTRRKYKNWSETVEHMVLCDKNIGDRLTKTKVNHDNTGDVIAPAVHRVNDTTPSVVHKNKKSDCKEFKHVSPGHVAELPLACNENEKGRITSRSTSCEDGSELMRVLERHELADSSGQKHARHKTDNKASEETRKNKYSKDEDKNSVISQNHEKMMGKKEDFEVEGTQRDAHSIEHRDITRTENENNEHVQKISLSESNKRHDTVEPEINNYTEPQWESVKSMNDVTLSEKEVPDYKEMQNGKCKEPIPEVSMFHGVIEERVLEISHKPTNNSFEVSAAPSKVSPVISLKRRPRRSMEVKLEDSKAVLSVNITPPKK
jgi:hypothetical protein